MTKQRRRSVVRSSRFLLLCHLISTLLLLHVAQGFTVSSRQQQLVLPDAITARTRRRGRQSSVMMLLLRRHGTKFSDDNNNDQKRRNNGRRRPNRDDDDNSLSSSSYLATCIPGISSALAKELTELGCDDVQITGPSAVRFTANNPATILSTLLWARTPHKIMQLLFAQQQQDDDNIYNRDDLYNCIRENVNVKDLLGNGRGGLLSLSVSVMFNNPGSIPRDINHSHFTALTIKNALVDAVRDLRKGQRGGTRGVGMLNDDDDDDDLRPNVDLEDPDVPLVAVLRGTTTTSSRDGTGGTGGGGGAQLSLYRQLHNGSLHRRGYRQEGTAIHKAAMKESLAAGLLLESEWDKICKEFKQQQQENGQRQQQQQHRRRLVLVDPMAGSGTLLLEGAIMAADVAPHLMRIKCGLTPGGKSQTFPPVVRWKHGNNIVGGGNNNENEVMEEWKRLLQDATVRAKQGLAWLKSETSSSNIELIANDWHPGALDLLDSALHQAGLNDGIVKVSRSNCRDFRPFSALTTSSSSNSTESETNNDADQHAQAAQPDVKVLVVTNPPWGVRLGGTKNYKNDNDNNNNDDDEEVDDVEDETLHDSWEALRVFLREACPPGKTEAWVLSGNKKSTKHLGLRRSKSIPMKVGQHDLRWIQYEIHDQQTKMAIMATKQQQQQQSRPSGNKDTQRQRPSSLIASRKDINPTTRIRQSWEEEEIVDRRQQTATTSTMSPPQLSLQKTRRRVVQSRQKAVSDENEWLLDE